MELPTNPEAIVAQNFRVNFKQSAKGLWYAEYTVRANTASDLQFNLDQAKVIVIEELAKLNTQPPG